MKAHKPIDANTYKIIIDELLGTLYDFIEENVEVKKILEKHNLEDSLSFLYGLAVGREKTCILLRNQILLNLASAQQKADELIRDEYTS